MAHGSMGCGAQYSFQATQLWEELMVAVHKLGSEGGFQAHELVSRLHSHVAERAEQFSTVDVNRLMITKLCQSMKEGGIIAPYGHTAAEFKDTTDAYIFVAGNHDLIGPLANINSAKKKPPTIALGRPYSFAERGTPRGPRRVLRSRNSESKSPTSSEYDNISVADSVFSCGSPSSQCSLDDDDNLNDFEATWELALFQLLTLVELPLLDGVLHVRATQAAWRPSFKLQSNKSRHNRHNPLLPPTLLDEPTTVCSVRCLPSLSEAQLDHMSALRLESRAKFLFSQVVKQENSGSCLIPKEMGDLCAQVFRLLSTALDKALAAIQLLLRLLSTESRDKMVLLVKLMRVFSDAQHIRLSHDLSNLDACLHEFTSRILPPTKSCSLTSAQQRHFLEFLIVHANDLTDMPDQFRQELSLRAEKRRYTVAEPQPLMSYCERKSSTEFLRQAVEGTSESLVALANSVADHPSMSLVEKKQWLQGFKKLHPDVFNQHLSHLEW